MERFTNNQNTLHESFSEHMLKKKKKKTADKTEAPAPGKHSIFLSGAGRGLVFLLLFFNKKTDTLERGRGEVSVSDL